MSPCPHGLAPSECLICRTLAGSPSVPLGTTAPKAGPPTGPQKGGGPVQRPDVVYPPGAAPRRAGSLGLHIGLIVAAVIVIGLAVWAVVGFALAILHVLELVLVAAVAGWAGYRIGKYRGSRRSR
jgi:hypothetical protein